MSSAITRNSRPAISPVVLVDDICPHPSRPVRPPTVWRTVARQAGLLPIALIGEADCRKLVLLIAVPVVFEALKQHVRRVLRHDAGMRAGTVAAGAAIDELISGSRHGFRCRAAADRIAL